MAKARQVWPAKLTSNGTASPPSSNLTALQSRCNSFVTGLNCRSTMAEQPVVQPLHRVRDMARVQGHKSIGLMRAVAHADPGASRIERHLLVQHARIGLAGRLVGGAGAVK